MQFLPVADPGTATSTGNTVTPEVRTFDSLTSADQAKLIKVMNVTLDSSSGNFLTTAQNINATQADSTLTLRTFANTDYNGTAIPVAAVNITCLVGQFGTGMQISPRFLSDFETIGGTPDAPVVSIESHVDGVRIFWEAVDGASGYRVEYSDNPADGFTPFVDGVLGASTLEYIDSTTADKMFYRVIALP